MDVQIAEARAFYAFQTMMEQVHSEAYSLLIETYVRDTEEKDFLFKGMQNSQYDWLSSKNHAEATQSRAFRRRQIGL